jgi:iron-sulfur cluster assembly accessory protein
MNTETANVVSLTPNALAKIKELTQSDPAAQGKALRISLEAGGCSGYQYGFSYDVKKEGDYVLASEGIDVVIDAKSGDLLKGSVVDYKTDLGSEGFAIQNPNVKKSCGCGNSVEI